MTLLLFGLAALTGLVLLTLLYWSMLDSLYPEKLSTNEVFLVTTEDLWKIRMCRYRKGRTGGQPVLLVHGANTNQHNFTCPEGSNLVDYLVERGYDCWTVDLRGCRSSEAPFERDRAQITTDDFLNDDIPTAIRFIQQETGYARVHYVGHSLGGMLLYAYALRFGTESIASAVTLGAPLGFENLKIRRPSLLLPFISLSPSLMGSMVRGCLPVVSCFRISTNVFPTNMHNVAKTLGCAHFYRMIEDPLPGVLGDICTWINHPGWRMDKGNLNVLEGLSKLDLPLFAIYAPLDPFVSIGNATEFFEALPTSDKRMLVCSKEKGFKQDYNHCDLAFSQEGPREIFGPISRWIETHSTRERMPMIEADVSTGYQSPVRGTERADILSGDSFAHLAQQPAPDAELAPTTPPSVLPREAKEAAPRKKKAPAKRKAAKKKPVARKATPKTEEPQKSSTEGDAPAATSPSAEATTSPRKAPGRSTEHGSDLAAASAALHALRPSPRTVTVNAPDITVRRSPTIKKSTEKVETPESVLKALSNASGVLNNLKKEEEK